MTTLGELQFESVRVNHTYTPGDPVKNTTTFYAQCGCEGGIVRVKMANINRAGGSATVEYNQVDHTEDCAADAIKFETLKNYREGLLGENL